MNAAWREQTPAVSVLLPIYNGGRYLADAVESALLQSFRDFELVAVDDGSTDESRHVLARYEDDRIRTITHTANRGQTEALRTALASSRGTYVARLDQDDVCYAERLERQIRYLETNPDVCVLGTGYELIDAEGRLIKGGGSVYSPIGSAELGWRFLWTDMLVDSTLMMRRDAVLRVGGFDPRYRYAQDFDLESRLCGIGKAARLTDRLVALRLHGASSSNRYTQEQESEVCHVIASAVERILDTRLDREAVGAIGRALGRFPGCSREDVYRITELVEAVLNAFLARGVGSRNEQLAIKQAAMELQVRIALRHPQRLSLDVFRLVLGAWARDPAFPLRLAFWVSRWRRMTVNRRYRAAVAANLDERAARSAT